MSPGLARIPAKVTGSTYLYLWRRDMIVPQRNVNPALEIRHLTMRRDGERPRMRPTMREKVPVRKTTYRR
jgi:hypothetical protein